MRGRRALLLVGTALNASYVIAGQIPPLIWLAPLDFGTYSLQYLVFALGSSVGLSVISEAWLRTMTKSGRHSPWAHYSGALVYLSLAAGLIGGAISICIPTARGSALLCVLAVMMATYRSGARYFDVREGSWARVAIADAAGLIATITTWAVIVISGQTGLTSAVLAWALGAVATVAAGRLPVITPPSSIGSWIRDHKDSIRPLLRDSLTADLGAIGTPYAIAPMLGVANFGIYRAVSNVAAPVRLVLGPLRPMVGSRKLSFFRRPLAVILVLVVSVLLGAVFYAALSVLPHLDIALGTLGQLANFALPTALFVLGNLISLWFYIVARVHLSGRALLSGRILQTGLAIVGPIGGVLVDGIHGALWAYATVTVVSALNWMRLVLFSPIDYADQPVAA